MSSIHAVSILGFIFVLIFFSAFFSASEIGMFSASRHKLAAMAKKKNRGAALALRLLNKSDNLLSTILICNNIVNVLAPSLATLMADRLYGNIGVAIAGGAMTFVLILFGEIIPKTFATNHPERFSAVIAYPIFFISTLFRPLVFAINSIIRLALNPFGLFRTNEQSGADKEEIKAALLQSKQMDGRHKNLLLEVLQLEEKESFDLMTPIGDVFFISLEESDEAIIKKLYESQHSRIPILKEDQMESLLGVLDLSNALKICQGDVLNRTLLTKHTHRALFVPERMSIMRLLATLGKEKKDLAVVVDAYGTITGLITYHDVLSYITKSFGDSKHAIGRREKEHTYLAEGYASILSLNDQFDLSFPTTGEAKTLSGFILEEIETIPSGRFCVKLEGMMLEVMTLKDGVIDKVRIISEPSTGH